MQQVLFWIPLKTNWTPNGIPLYGFGTMLFLSFVVSMWLANRRAERNGVSKERLLDLAMWVFIGGIVGARIVFMIQYKVPLRDWFKFWEGGIVFYGSAVGGWIGYCAGLAGVVPQVPHPDDADRGHRRPVGVRRPGDRPDRLLAQWLLLWPCLPGRRNQLSADDGAGSRAGRWPGLADRGGVWAGRRGAGHAGAPAVVGPVEPASEAAAAGLRRGDIIVSINGQPIPSPSKLQNLLLDWPRGVKQMAMEVSRGGVPVSLTFTPRTLKLHPTQVYETISMLLLFFVLVTFYPFRRHDGQVFVLLMLGYAVHRFFNETLRNDTDPVFLNLTLSQVGSIAVFAAGIALELYLRARTPRLAAPAAQGPA